MVGLHDSVTMSFMLVGHTKFCQDWCFGLLKQRYKTFVSCLQDIVDVNSSADVNTAQLAGTQDGEVVVPTYDWAQFLGEHCRKVPQMKSYHHFYPHRSCHLVSPMNGSGTSTERSGNSVDLGPRTWYVHCHPPLSRMTP